MTLRRWKCPVCGDVALAPQRPRKRDVRRYCLSCSAKTGRLVDRFCPVLTAARDKRREKSWQKAQTAAEREAKKSLEYPAVLRLWAVKWRALNAWENLQVRPTALIIRRGSKKKNTSGHAYPSGHGRGRIIITAGSDGADALATLLHEMAHLRAGPNAAHGPRWRGFFLEAAREVTGQTIDGTLANRFDVHDAVTEAMRELAERNKLGSPEPEPKPKTETPRHEKNRTGYRSLDAIAADPRVESIWDEGSDGIWIQLVDGYNCWGASVVHEWKVRDLIKEFHRGVEKGDPS